MRCPRCDFATIACTCSYRRLVEWAVGLDKPLSLVVKERLDKVERYNKFRCEEEMKGVNYDNNQTSI